MRSYALYRIASTIHFLLFFFISILAFNFALPDILIILIAVLNDAATLVIAVDNARISNRPDKWRLGQLLTLSFILGFLLMLVSYAHFFFARSVYPFTITSGPNGLVYDNLDNWSIVQTIMYLQISSCPHFVIFSTRLGTWWWKSAPSWFFLLAILGTQVIAAIICLTGPAALSAYPIGWGWTIGVLAVSGVVFMLLDVVKVYTFKYWSFELTATLWPSPAHLKKLNKRKAEHAIKQRVDHNMKKVRNAFAVVRAHNAFSEAGRRSTAALPFISAKN